MLKNRFFTILILLTLLTPVYAETGVNMDFPDTIQQEVLQDNDIVTEEAEESKVILPKEELNPESFKQPTSKKKIAKKFLFAMLGVAISSIVLFVMLSLYNRIRGAILNPQAKTVRNETSLVTPDNLTNAVKAYLAKTNWDK